jgi:hypothetical protein
MIMQKSHRSAIFQLRCGTAPLRIETGCYEGIPEEERLYFHCKSCVENELHVLVKCPLYSYTRYNILQS